MDEEAIWALLKGVPDPEIPVVSVVDLGIVRAVAEDRVTITTTYSGCPASAVIEQSIREALDDAGYRNVRIETALSPPWTTEWISEGGRAALQQGSLRTSSGPIRSLISSRRRRGTTGAGLAGA